MDGQHHHQHSDPDLKIFVIAIIGIVGIIIGPAIMASMWIFVLALGVTFGLSATGLIALVIHNVKKSRSQLPPMRQPMQQYPGKYGTLRNQYPHTPVCTIHWAHNQTECNGYHLEIGR